MPIALEMRPMVEVVDGLEGVFGGVASMVVGACKVCEREWRFVGSEGKVGGRVALGAKRREWKLKLEL
jgi:hypothetical protein